MIVCTGFISRESAERVRCVKRAKGLDEKKSYIITGYQDMAGSFAFDVIGDNIDKLDLHEGQFVTVYLQNEAREWDNKYYNRIICTRCEHFPHITKDNINPSLFT